jgi:lipopolysaccharide transport system ATP-binding protein
MTAIQVLGVTKVYKISHRPGSSRLSEAVVHAMQSARSLHRRDFRSPDHLIAVDDISFEVAEGEVVGIVGPNGAGKSTVLKILTRITAPTSGRVVLRGRVGSLLEVGTGFHPDLTGRENIFLNGSLLGMTRREIVSRFEEIVEFAGVERFIDTPVKRYSSGMHVRLAFSVAAHLEPEILLVDEVLAVGDALFLRKCIGKLDEVAHAGRTVIVVSHNLATVERLCPRVLLMEGGRLIADGPASDVLGSYIRRLGDTAMIWKRTQPSTSDAFIQEMALIDSAGEVLTTVTTAGTLRVAVKFRILRRTEGLVPGMALLDSNGVPIFATSPADLGTIPPTAPGYYEAVIALPSEALLGRTYSVRAAIELPHSPVLDVVEGLRFTCEEVASIGTASLLNRPGQLVIPCEWSINPIGD